MIRLALVPLALVATAEAAEYHYLAASEAGRLRCGAPAGFAAVDFDERGWLADGGDRADNAVRGASSDGTSACDVLRIRRRFDVGPEAARLVTLTLRAKYHDGLVAWINGVEVVRRRLGEEGALADERRGPEEERFVVPVGPGLLHARDNLLAVEVRSARPGRAPSAEVALDGADGLRIIRGPYLQHVFDGTARVLLDTDLPSRVAVSYRPAGAALAEERSAKSAALATHHTVLLTGLAAGTAYRYRISAAIAGWSEGAATAESTGEFHTPPTADHPLRFVVFGDVRSGHDVHAAIVGAVVAEDPDLVLLTGDLVDRGSDEGDWERYFEVAEPLLRQVAVYPALGNHEYVRRGEGRERFLTLFPRDGGTAWWSFDIAGVHFICLDSEAFRDPAQLEWLTRDLAAAHARRPRAIFAFAHDGPWSSQLHGDNAVAIHDYAPLLERGGVTVIFSGHDHDYERGQVGGLAYVVSGGGGAELRAPRCGVPGKRRCPSRVRAFANEHHYIVVDVMKDRLRLCPKRADGTLLEACPTLPLRR